MLKPASPLRAHLFPPKPLSTPPSALHIHPSTPHPGQARPYTATNALAAPPRTMAKSKPSPESPPSLSSPPVKYCQNCGRLISSNHRNFEERKYCSKYCSSNRLYDDDRELERLFVTAALSKGSVTCDEVQALQDGPNGAASQTSTEQVAAAEAIEDSSEEKQKAGMDAAKWRERVRRAARRVVTQHRDEGRFEAVQKGKVVEPSYAKGDWAVRHVKT